MSTTPTPAPQSQEQPAAQTGTPLLTKQAIAQRHPLWAQWKNIWRYYRDMYEGGVQWPGKINPLQAQALSQPSIAGEMSGGGDFVPEKAPMGGAFGMVRYLWQYPLEKDEKYRHRLARAFYVNIVAPVVDFYAAVISKTDNVSWTGEAPEFETFWNNCDLQGQSYLQFMTAARSHAAAIGHTFILCDNTKAQGDIVTQRDVIEQGIRPYLVEIWPENMLNWRLDRNGEPLEILYCSDDEVPGSIADVAPQAIGRRYYYWTREFWQVYTEQPSAKPDETVLVLEDEGTHTLGRIPITVLYHKRVQPFLGVSLLKDSAKIGHILSNWASALDESFEAHMFAMPVLTSRKSPTDAGVGSSTVLHLNPDEKEKFEYVAPDTGPFAASWDAFYRMVELANKHMGIAPTAVGSGKVDAKSGVSKAWDFFESEKILSRMAGNEQDVSDVLFKLAAEWAGGDYDGGPSYKTQFDLSTAEDDINDLISLQSAGVPPTARKEMMRQVVFKKLPNLPDDKRDAINKEVDEMQDLPDPADLVAPGGGAAGLPVPAARPVDRAVPGRPLVAPGAAKEPGA
jgi:hypothetical protein